MFSVLLSLGVASALECNRVNCPSYYLNDGYCEQSCSIIPCFLDIATESLSEPLVTTFEASDCFVDCILACDWSHLGNSVCDADCDLAICGYDLGECGYCASGCKPQSGFEAMLGDGACDTACNTPECWADDGDCVRTRQNCSPGCTKALLNNAVCDADCDTYDCTYDNWSCVKPTQTCAPGCYNFWLGDGWCDYDCNTLACWYDYDDCVTSMQSCATDCLYADLINGSCDAACDNEACAHDNYDCVRTRQTCAAGCTQALLTNDQCDSACRVKACNFDSKLCVRTRQSCAEGCAWSDVGDGICDAVCDTADCDRDGGDCVISSQGCAAGCDKAMLGDGTCQAACYSEECLWDKTDCSSQFCSSKCSPSLQFNSQCDQECNFASCNYDEANCLCAPSCSPDVLGDLNCDNDCDTKECSYDSQDCVSSTQGTCASQCYPSMVGDGYCDNACYKSSCGYDFSDCCNWGCSGLEGTCDPACLYSECGYDKDAGCADDFLTDSARFFQMYFEDFYKTLDFSDCYAEDPNCDEGKLRDFYAGTGTDMTACTSKSCLGQFGQGQCCAADIHCKRCIGSYCLECEDDYYQWYYLCVESCPPGYKEHSKVSKLCYPSYDYSYEDSPELYFISATETGSAYRSDLASTLAEAWQSYVVVYLTDAITELSELTDAAAYEFDTKSTLEPLRKTYDTSTKRMTIATNLCNLHINSNCLNQKAKIRLMDPRIRLYVGKYTLVLENVDIEGYYSLDNSCSAAECSYCPFLQKKNGLYIDDRFNVYSSWPNWGDCTDLSKSSFFEGDCNSSLILKNIDITDFRQQLRSFVSTSGSLQMTQVTFNNIQPTAASNTAFIVQDCSTCGTSPCDFEYSQGSVEYLNNGYEYSSQLSQAGFLRSIKASSATIQEVEFKSNFKIKSYKVSDAASKQHLLYFSDVTGVVKVEHCSFKSNIVTGELILVDSSAFVLTTVAYTYDNELLETTLDHVSVKSCSFTGNTVGGLVKVLYGAQMLNVLLQGLTIEDNVASSSLFEVTHSEVPSDLDINGGFNIYTIDGKRRGLKLLPRHTKLLTITITRSYWANCAFQLQGLSGLSIYKIWISQSGAFTGDINAFTVDALMLDSAVYLSKPIDFGYSSVDCQGTFVIEKTFGVTASRLEFSDIQCQGCTGVSVGQSIGSVTLENVKAVRLESGNTQGGLLSFPLMERGTVTLSKINVDTLTSTSGSGVAYADLTSLTLTDSTFKNVVASLSPGLYLTSMKSITVSGVVFKSLESINGFGAGIQANFDTIQGVTFTLTSSQFTDCKTTAFRGAGVAVMFSVSPLEFQLDACEFSYNYAKSGGSSIYIESTVLFTATSKVSNSKFFKNRDLVQGTFTGNLANSLSIERSQFYDNSSTEDVIFVGLTSAVSVLRITSSSLYGNTSNAGLNARGSGKDSQLVLTSCQFYKNSAESTVLLEKCTMTGDSLVFTENTGPLTMQTAYSSLRSSSFTKNTNTDPAGAVELYNSSTFSCTKCTFSENSAKAAGAIRVDSKSVLTLLDCVITGNTAETGSAIYLINSRENNLVENSSVTLNTAKGAGAIVLIESKLTIKASSISENIGASLIPGIATQSSDIIIESSTLASQKSTQAVFFDLQASSTGSFTKTTFRDGKSESGGGVGKVQNSSAVFVGCTFDSINSGLGSAILASLSPITMRELTATQITSQSQGALLQTTSTTLELSGSSVSWFNQTAISSSNMESVLISNCVFERGTAAAETVLKVVNFSKVKVTGSSFRHNYASSYTSTLSLKVLSTWSSNSSLEVSQSSFLNNSAPSIGCIYTDVKTVLIANSTFYNNSASSGSAGALQLDCIASVPCDLTVASNNFTSNAAALNGGAVYWTKQQPVFSNNSFTNNSAVYGPDIASFGIKLTSLDFQETTGKLSKVSGDTYLNIGSGQRLPQTISIALKDHAGQVVTTDNSSIASVLPANPDNVTVTGESRVTAVQGVYYFTGVKFSAEPGVNIKVLLSSDALTSLTLDDSGYSSDLLSVDLQVRECQVGEALVGKDCVPCEAGTYSLDPTQSCLACPSGANCLGGSLALPKAGYWRPTKTTSTFFACPNSAACLGSPHIMPSLTGVCLLGYRGNKCQPCDNGYSRATENKCGKCPDAVGNAFRLLGMIAVMTLICGVLVRSSIRTAYQPTVLHSIYLKIFANYLQLVLLTTQLELEWPSFVYALFSAQKNAGTATDQFLSVDCYLSDPSNDDSYKNVYFDKITIIAMIPIIFTLAATAFWCMHFLANRDAGVFKKQWISTIVILFFMIHPNILRSNFSYFSCSEILPGEYWLNENLDIRCFDSTHNATAVMVVVPSLLLWGLFTPLTILMHLIRRRKQLKEILTKLRFGFLYNGFKKSKFYWEFVIMYRKVLIICCVVFIGNRSIPIQALTVILLLLNFLIVQYLTRPYANKQLNEMELRSILVATVTIYCGLFFLTKDLDWSMKVFFFVIMLLINLYFFHYFFSNLFRTLAAKISNPTVRRLLGMPKPNEYPEVNLQAAPSAWKTAMVDDEKSCTLFTMTGDTRVPTSTARQMKDLYQQSVSRQLALSRLALPMVPDDSLIVEDLA
jgi:hypothetical protein